MSKRFAPTKDTPHPPFEIVKPAFMFNGHDASKASVIITTPHAGLFIPDEEAFAKRIKPSLNEFRSRADIATDAIVFDAAHRLVIPLLASTISPQHTNVGRPRNATGRNDIRGILSTLIDNTDDDFVRRGQGLFASTNFVDGRKLYIKGREPDEVEALERLSVYYDPFHAQHEELVRAAQSKQKKVLVFDIHSYPAFALAGEPDETGTPRPNILFSNRDGSSCPEELLELCADIAEKHGYSVGRNDPYKGGFITQKFSMANHDNGFNTISLQVEMSRDAYGLDPAMLNVIDFKKFKNMQACMAKIIEAQNDYMLRTYEAA